MLVILTTVGSPRACGQALTRIIGPRHLTVNGDRASLTFTVTPSLQDCALQCEMPGLPPGWQHHDHHPSAKCTRAYTLACCLTGDCVRSTQAGMSIYVDHCAFGMCQAFLDNSDGILVANNSVQLGCSAASPTVARCSAASRVRSCGGAPLVSLCGRLIHTSFANAGGVGTPLTNRSGRAS